MNAQTAITFLVMPKPFQGHIGVIQRNASTSWTKLQPRPEIKIFWEIFGPKTYPIRRLAGVSRDPRG